MKKGRLETMVEEGLNPRVVEGMSVLDGVNAARCTLPRVVFHERCEEQGIAALEQYQREWDDENKVFRKNSPHNWASNQIGRANVGTPVTNANIVCRLLL